jgi:hypothetical protein
MNDKGKHDDAVRIGDLLNERAQGPAVIRITEVRELTAALRTQLDAMDRIAAEAGPLGITSIAWDPSVQKAIETAMVSLHRAVQDGWDRVRSGLF